MDRLRQAVLRAAASDGPVLIAGEAGTGKSLVALAVVEQSQRGGQRCAMIDCEALPGALVDVELFGCVRRGPSAASAERRGVLETCDGGTVIVEGLEVTSAETQAAIECFLETGRVRLTGATSSGNPADTRLVITTTSPLSAATAPTRSQSELWSRLAGNTIVVPPLRERRSDVPLLAQFFASTGPHRAPQIAFSAEAMTALSTYTWPGNVTQLRQVVRRLIADAPGKQVRPSDLPVGIRPRSAGWRDDRTRRLVTVGGELFGRVRASGESFWSSVYPLFMRREITRADLRDLVRHALESAGGDNDGLVSTLNMPASDQRKFVRFLRKYGCEPHA